MHNGQPDAALARMAALDVEASDPCLLVRASIHYRLKRYDMAMADWEALIARSPATVEAWIGKGRILHTQDRRERVDELVQQYLDANPALPGRYLQASKLASTLWRPSFEGLIARASEEAEGDPLALLAIAVLYRKTGRMGLASLTLDQVASLDAETRGYLKERMRVDEALSFCQIDAAAMGREALADIRYPDQLFEPLLALAPRAAYRAEPGFMLVTTTLGPGGAERQIVNTIRGLRAAGRQEEIVVAQLKNDNPDVDAFYSRLLAGQGVKTVTIGKAAIERLPAGVGDVAAMRTILNALPGSFQLEVERTLSVISKHRPLVVHAWNDHRSLAAGVAAVLAGTPTILLSGRSVAPPGTRVVPDFFRAAYVALSKHPRVRLVNNSQCGARTYEDWLGLRSGAIGVVYNGIDLQHLDASRDDAASRAIRQRLGLGDEVPLVGSLFRISSEKRPELWLQSVEALLNHCPQAHFVLAGEGPLRAEMEAGAARLGIGERVHFLGLVEQVVPLYQALDAVLLTSSREGTSNTALEAQALGLPVVTPAVGGMPEVVVDGVSGFVVDKNPTAEAVAEKLAHCLTQREWRATAGAAARAMVEERFSIEAMAQSTLDSYGDLQESKSKAEFDLVL